MYSNGFYITGDTSVYYLDDNGLGKVRFYTLLPSGDKVYNSLYSGSVNYDTGAISLANISISSIVGAGQLGIVVKPLNNDIFPVRNQIILLDLDELSIQMLEDTDEYNENYEVSSQRVQVSRNITTTYSDGQYSAGISSGATSGTVSQRVYSESPSGGSSSGGSSSGGSSSGGSSSGGGY